MSEQVKVISELFVRPESELEGSKRKHYLSPVEYLFLPMGYAQHGQVYKKEGSYSSSTHLEKLKLSLSKTLTHFYLLAGRLATEVLKEDVQSCCIYIDCKKGPGAKLISAGALHLSISDLVSPDKDVPLVVRSFFDLGTRLIGHDGTTEPLLSVQVTELADGVFVGASISHCVVDGTSTMNFLRFWSEMFKESSSIISRLPTHYQKASTKVTYKELDELVKRVDPPQIRDRIFHFSIKSMAMLKAKARAQAQAQASGPHISKISSFQALSALVWRAITRARNLPMEEPITCSLPVNLRSRLEPPLSEDCIGILVSLAMGATTVGELLANNLGWAAMQIFQGVAAIGNKTALEAVSSVVGMPSSNHVVQMSGSPRMNLYEIECGLGRPVAVLTGLATKEDMDVIAFTGSEGLGSVELHISLPPQTMEALLSDNELLSFAASTLESRRPRL